MRLQGVPDNDRRRPCRLLSEHAGVQVTAAESSRLPGKSTGSRVLADRDRSAAGCYGDAIVARKTTASALDGPQIEGRRVLLCGRGMCRLTPHRQSGKVPSRRELLGSEAPLEQERRPVLLCGHRKSCKGNAESEAQ